MAVQSIKAAENVNSREKQQERKQQQFSASSQPIDCWLEGAVFTWLNEILVGSNGKLKEKDSISLPIGTWRK